MFYDLMLKPYWKEDTVSALDVTIRTDCPAEKGKTVFTYFHDLVTIPFCPAEGTFLVKDELGKVPYEVKPLPAIMNFIHPEGLIAERDTSGEITLSYRILPRVQPEDYHSSPYFDLVAEKGGVNGTGTTFLCYPGSLDDEADLSLTWDLSLLPEGCRGIWTFSSDLHAKKHLTFSEFLWTVFACGKVNSSEHGKTGFYWFDTLPFPAEEGAERITKMFEVMSDMFHDTGEDYRVFARHNHFAGNGGTALTRSYLYGYGKDDRVDLDDLQDLLAHEMVHNWPTMIDDPPGKGTWYVEGSAEYYSTMVPMEMGIRSIAKTAEVINSKAGAYWKNPMHNLSNEELGKRYWTDRRCQRVPYARGILFLANTDAAIQKATDGKKKLLDVELELLKKKHPEPEDFLRAVKEISGLDLSEAYECMCRGDDPIPDPDAFSGHFIARKEMVHEQDHQHVAEYDNDAGKEVPGWVWYPKQLADH